MKLLFFASDYKIGLSFLLTEELKFLVNQKGLDVLAIAGTSEQTNGLTQQLKDANVPTARIEGLDSHRDFKYLAKEIANLIRENRFNYIHVQNNWQLALVVYIKYFYHLKFKILYTIHGYRHNSFFKSIIAKTLIDIVLFLFVHKVFVASSEVKRKFILSSWKSNVLYLGVENDFFNIQQPDFNQTHKNLIFAGQFRQGKNQHQIIEALAMYIKKTGDKAVSLYLPGDGPLKLKCIELAKACNISDNVVFPGLLNRQEILALYARCQIAVIATNSETFGHCIAEPFVMGMCVITKKVGIAHDIIKNGTNGLIYKDTKELAGIFEKYINDNNTLSAIGNAAYNDREIFRWSNICSIYNDIINKHEKFKAEAAKTNLLYFATDYKIGLSVTLRGQAASIMSLDSINIVCVASDREQVSGLTKKYEESGLFVHRIKSLGEHKHFNDKVRQITDIIRKNNIKVVHVHNNWQLLLVTYIKYFRRTSFKVIYSIHGFRHNNLCKAFFAKIIIGLSLYLFSDIVLAGSTELKNALPFIKRKCKLLTQGVENEIFEDKSAKKFGETKKIIFAGQFRKGKNQDKLINVLYNYSLKTGDKDYKLILPGEGELLNACKELVNKIGFENIVEFPGQLNRNEMNELYSTSHIAIIPTNYETFGYCIAEPYVAGLCVISRKTGIAEDIIEHEKSGLLFSEFNELEELLIKYMNNNDKLNEFARNSFLNRDVLRWEKITNHYEMMVEELND